MGKGRAMTDEELVVEFVRVERVKTHVGIWVKEIHWDGQHTPLSKWILYVSLPANTAEVDVDFAIKKLLDDDKYFQVCNECNECNPVGWMCDDEICQDCAERNHRVVF